MPRNTSDVVLGGSSGWKVVMRRSHLGSHARVKGILILCGAHLLPPHHLLQAHVIVVLEVAHTLAIHMSLDLTTAERWKQKKETKHLVDACEKDTILK